ncbi:MAG: DUF4112 domain-containing protein [Steroidobacteraceae bacterium]
MNTPDDPRLHRLAQLTRLLDQAFRIPGTRWYFGFEAILGLIPGLGDISGALFGGYGLLLAHRMGAPAWLLGRMLLNLGVDAMVGAIPLAGDVFDLVFKAHVRNQQLLRDWLDSPHKTARASKALLLGGCAALLLMFAGSLWLAVACIGWLLRHTAG